MASERRRLSDAVDRLARPVEVPLEHPHAGDDLLDGCHLRLVVGALLDPDAAEILARLAFGTTP